MIASGNASAQARAEVLGEALVEGAINADVGIDESDAKAAVQNEIGIFAEVTAKDLLLDCRIALRHLQKRRLSYR